MTEKNIATITSELYTLLKSCTPEERQRAVKATFALLGEELLGTLGSTPLGAGQNDIDLPVGTKAKKWLSRHGITSAHLESVFYFHDGKVDIHTNTAPGNGKREQTVNCYLLTGTRAFMENDTPSFTDSDAIALCKHTQAYDKNNHTTNRGALGNWVNGSRQDGFELTGPGLKAAADLLLEMNRTK